jgi:hypothetical protein
MMATDKDEKPRDDDYPDIVPEDTRGDLALEAGALVANFLPGLGGALANVLSGWSAERKRERVREVISGLALRLANLQSTLADEYVRGDEFEDLLDQTLRRVANERHESKRRLYREFLVAARFVSMLRREDGTHARPLSGECRADVAPWPSSGSSAAPR